MVATKLLRLQPTRQERKGSGQPLPSTAMTDYTETTSRLRVLWNRGRQFYSSFYAELQTARAEIGDDRFADWCFYELRISLSIMQNVAAVLQKADAERVKQELMVSKRLAQAQAKAARDAARAASQRKREAATASAKRAKSNAYQRTRRARIKEEATAKSVRISENPYLAELVIKARGIVKTSRVDCGHLYAEMKRAVQAGEAGNDEFGKKWRWTRWATLHIDRSVRDIDQCIVEFRRSISETQNTDNVVTLVNISGAG